MGKLSQNLRIKPLFISALLAFSTTACSFGGGDSLANAEQAYESHEYRAARAHIVDALKENSMDPDANMVFGKILLAMGDGEGALAAFRKIENDAKYKKAVQPLVIHAHLLNEAPDKALDSLMELDFVSFPPKKAAKYYWLTAATLLRQQKNDEALEVIEAGLKRTPADVDLLVLKGDYALASGDMYDASKNAKAALKAEPDDLKALLLSGRLAMLDRKLKTAKKHFLKAEKLYPDSIPPLFSLAAIHADMGNEKKSLAYFEKLKELAPNHPISFFMRAQIEYDKGNVSKARDLMQKAGDFVINIPEAILLNGLIANDKGNYETAIANLQRYLHDVPGDSLATMKLAEALHAVDNKGQASALIKRTAERSDATPIILRLAAKLAKGRGDPTSTDFAAGSIQSGNKALKTNIMQADAAVQAKKWAEAKALYAEIRDSGEQSNPLILSKSATVALEMGENDEAIGFARQALKAAPADPIILDTLGWVILKSGGDKKEALKYIKDAASKAPDHPEIQAHLKKAQAAG